MQIDKIYLDSYAPFWSTDENGNREKKKMYNIVDCDGCGVQLHDPMIPVTQVTGPKAMLFFCPKCTKELRNV